VGAEHAARKLKIYLKNKINKKLLSSLYVYKRNVNCAVGNENVC
jgi:hypothetical protein